MKKIIIVACTFLFTKASFSQNTFPTTAGSFAGIGTGTTTPATALHILYNNSSANLSPANFITIENRGTNVANTNQNIIGGLMFAGYQTGKSAANVAGIWGLRYPLAADGSTSNGALIFGVSNLFSTTGGVNIATDNQLPAEAMRLTNGCGFWLKSNLTNTDLSRPLVTDNVPTEIRGASATAYWMDDGFLRLSAGGGSNGNTKSYIDLSGYTVSTSDRQMNITFGTEGLERMRIDLNGNTGIGTTAPSQKLEVNGNILSDGNVYIGGGNGITVANTTGYALAVNGTAIFTKAVVKLSSSWPDYVFEPNYNLTPLNKVEEFIKAHHYLPGIAPAAQMQKDGLDVGDNQTKLLQKIEELTLYIIEQDKKQKQQQQLNEQQNKTIEEQSEILQKQQILLQKMQAELAKIEAAQKK